MSVLSWIKRNLTGAPDASEAEPPPATSDARQVVSGKGDRRTGLGGQRPLDDPPGTGKRNRDAAPEILGDV